MINLYLIDVYIQAYPKSVWFIICTEFCERFSYYGLRSTYLFFILLNSTKFFVYFSQL